MDRQLKLLVLATTIVIGLFALPGCSRMFWREQANRDSYTAIGERLGDPRWQVPRIDVTPHPLSRFASLGDPDEPPLPPDDPAAHRYMHLANGIKGYRSWHEFGQAFSIENPQWLASVQPASHTVEPADGTGAGTALAPTEISLPEALELATIHSRDYQTEIENLYLAALELTFERFQFDVRYLGLGGREPGFDVEQRSQPVGNETTGLNSSFGVSRFLPSGGQIAVELANNTLWLFTGPNRSSTASTLSYALTQPLLFAAGRKVVLEALTQAERNVLYAARNLARFRRVYFTDIVASPGIGYLNLLQQRQIIANRIDNVGRLISQLERLREINTPRPRLVERTLGFPAGVSVASIPASLTGPAGEETGRLSYDDQSRELTWTGFISDEQREALADWLATLPEPDLLFDADDPLDVLTNRWFTEGQPGGLGGLTARVGSLEASARRSRADVLREAVREILARLNTEAETLPITQLKTQLATARNQLRQSQASYRDSLDQFKILIGLATDLPVTIDESLLEPFRLIDDELIRLEEDLTAFPTVIYGIEDENPTIDQVQRAVRGLERLRERLVENGLNSVANDLRRAEALLSGKETETEGTASILGAVRKIDSEVERERLRTDLTADRKFYLGLETEFRRNSFSDLRSIEARLTRFREQAGRTDLTTAQILRLRKDLVELQEDMLRLSRNLEVLQTNVRVELLPLQPFELDEETVILTALTSRLDLMNERARVMDGRRRVEVAANALRAALDLRVEGDIRTGPTNNPGDFRGDQSDFRFGLQFTSPLDRLAERNAYRAALIDYERLRRDYIAAEDAVKFDVRTAYRQLEVLRDNFETSRIAVRAAARQYDSAVESSLGAEGQGGLNLLNALSSLLNAQNSLIQTWVDYERNRLAIYRDMGIMEIDQRGIWVDSFYQGLAARQLDPDRMPLGPRSICPPMMLPAGENPGTPLFTEENGEHNHIDGDLFLGADDAIPRDNFPLPPPGPIADSQPEAQSRLLPEPTVNDLAGDIPPAPPVPSANPVRPVPGSNLPPTSDPPNEFPATDVSRFLPIDPNDERFRPPISREAVGDSGGSGAAR